MTYLNHLAEASLPLNVGYIFFGGIQHSPSMVVQQRVVILEFLQEKMNTRPSIPSSHHLISEMKVKVT